jgi:hypothetical protein
VSCGTFPATAAEIGEIFAVLGVDTMKIEGIVQPCFLDSVCLSHRICILATDGHVYEVEPNFVGLYLERFVGHRVEAQVQPVTNGNRRNEVRLLSLKALDEIPVNAHVASACGVDSSNSDRPNQILSELEIGRAKA